MARVAASLLIAGLGGVSAFAVVGSSRADEPIPSGAVATVYRTVTETRADRYQGHGVRWWARRTVKARREANLRAARIRRLEREARRRWAPTVSYGLELARAVYGVDQRRRAYCESTLNPGATSPGGHMGLMQFLGSTWRSTPFGGFSPYDPLAAALAGGWMVTHGRTGEWSCPL